MLGIFDSGYGGLTILKEIRNRLPNISTMYLGDNARAPYGTRAPEEILAFAWEGVCFLFEKGCPLVILACNTASADALREIQQTFLPKMFPDRRVLGVIRPTVEVIGKEITLKRVGVFATQATVSSGAYVRELAHLVGHLSITQQACAGLVDAIERGETTTPKTAHLVALFVKLLLKKDPMIETVILGCTHYPLVLPLFRAALPSHINLVVQGPIVAEKLAGYLVRHPEINRQLDQFGHRLFFTTGAPNKMLASYFYGNEIHIRPIMIDEILKIR